MITKMLNTLRLKGWITEGYNPNRDKYELCLNLGPIGLVFDWIKLPQVQHEAEVVEAVAIEVVEEQAGVLALPAPFEHRNDHPFIWKLSDAKGEFAQLFRTRQELAKELATLRCRLASPVIVENQETKAWLVREPMVPLARTPWQRHLKAA